MSLVGKWFHVTLAGTDGYETGEIIEQVSEQFYLVRMIIGISPHREMRLYSLEMMSTDTNEFPSFSLFNTEEELEQWIDGFYNDNGKERENLIRLRDANKDNPQ